MRTSRVLAALAGAWLAATAGGAGPAGAAPLRYVVLPGESRVEFVSGTQLGEFRGGTGDLAGDVVYDPAAARAGGPDNFCVHCHRADGEWRERD